MSTEKVENSSPGFAAPLLIAAWAVVLLIAFFANRGSDVGQLGKLIGNLTGGPLFGWEGFKDSFIGGLIAIVILIAWFGLGSLITKFIRRERNDDHSHVLEIVIDIAVGAAAWSFVWFFLGLAGLYISTVAIVVTGVGVASAVYGLKRVREMRSESSALENASGADRLLIVLIAVPVVLAFIGALAPPTAKDTLLYHFALPKAFIAQHSNAFVEGNIASYLALGAEMHNVWAMLLGGLVDQRAAEAAAGAVNWLVFPLLLAAVCGWARELNFSRRSSLIAVLMVAAVPSAYHVASSAYIDLELTLYLMLAVYGLTRWWRSQENGWLILSAIFLGASLSIKLTTLFIFAAFALVIVFRAREAKENGAGRIIALGFGSLVLAALIASPWYLRTWKATGSPLFPFYMSIWKGGAPGWDVDRSNLFQTMNSNYGGKDKSAVDYLISPWNISVTAQPEESRSFDGVIGVAFLAGLPLLVFALWKLEMPAEIKICAGVAGIMFLFWLFSSQQLRYLLPILPLLSIAILYSAEKVSETLRNVTLISLAAASVAAMLVSFAWFAQRAPLRVVLGGETRDSFLTRNIDYYPYYALLNAEAPTDAKVWLINMRRDTYSLDRPAMSDYLFEDWTLRQMVWESRSTLELKAKVAAMGVQYVLSRTDVLLDYDRSALVDDQKPRAENEAKLRIAREVLLDPARTVKADNKFSLIKVF
jgi:dolichyl-phosphate-mannose-protein mannosyltransferase